jgi:lipoprotein-anchoring transpeptidase ErfK/SrfK
VIVAAGTSCGDGDVVVSRPKSVTMVVTPADGTRRARPDGPIGVWVRDGRIRSVTLTDGHGAVEGLTDPGRTRWWPRWALRPGRAYSIRATALGADGGLRTVRASFRTRLAPRTVPMTVVAPREDSTVGVGMPIIVHFAAPVGNRAGVERSLEVRASRPVSGAWRWISDTDAVFRTRTYWPAHTRVRLLAHLTGLRITPGAYGAQDVATGFQVGDSHITLADAHTHHQEVRINGHGVRLMPISMGKATHYRFTTTSGVHLTMDKVRHIVMDSASVGCPPGCPDHYREDVYYAVRISDSGEYEHSAPWSVGAQGSHNVSHGCINMGPRDALWFYRRAQPGDVVEVTGTRRRLRPDNGWGFWQLPWEEWLGASAAKTDAGAGLAAPVGPPG